MIFLICVDLDFNLFHQKALTRHKCKLIINSPSNAEDSDGRASFQEDKLVVYKSEDESKFRFCIYLDETLKISIFSDLSWELHINSGKKYRFTAKNWREDQKWFGMIYKNLVDRYRNFYLNPAENDDNDDDQTSVLTVDGNLRFMPQRQDSFQNETSQRYPLGNFQRSKVRSQDKRPSNVILFLDLNDIYELIVDPQKTSSHLRQQFANSVFRIRITQDQILLKDRNSDKSFSLFAK